MVPLLRPRSVRAAFYLFPNPPRDYHKERANARRRHFLQNLHDALIPGGRVYFATDAPLFFECVSDIVNNDLHFKTLASEITDDDMITRYRRMWEEKGRSVRCFAVRKDHRARMTAELKKIREALRLLRGHQPLENKRPAEDHGDKLLEQEKETIYLKDARTFTTIRLLFTRRQKKSLFENLPTNDTCADDLLVDLFPDKSEKWKECFFKSKTIYIATTEGLRL